MLEQPKPVQVGSVHENDTYFQHQIDACDGALRRLTQLPQPPYAAIEALLLARHVAGQKLAEVRLITT